MLLATFAVAVLPVLVVSAIQATGVLQSTVACVCATALLSLAASAAGSALWTRRRGARDLIFADLMIWGWIGRLRAERRLANATELLGDRAKLSPSRQARLLERLSTALEARDPYTHGHSRRVTRYSEAIARGMGLSRGEVARVRTAAAVHDVGKIKTPREILNSPGKLTDEEFATIALHAADGAELVAGMGDPELTAMVRHHHERLDGRGYPDGLEAADIPLGSRIVAVADTFDAITSSRTYRSGGKHKAALDILRKEAGSQLDPAAVAAFLSYYSGTKSVAGWSLLAAGPPRFVLWLVGWLQGAGATPIAKGVVAAGAAAMIGGSISPPAPEANSSKSASRPAAAQRPADPVPSAGPVADAPGPGPRSRLSGDGAGARPSRPSRRASPVVGDRPEPIRSRRRPPGSRERAPGSEAGPGDSSSPGGNADPGGGSGAGSDPRPLPTTEPPVRPRPPVEHPLPEIRPPKLPPLPVEHRLPEIDPPKLPSLPVEHRLPEIQLPELPPLPDTRSLPKVKLPPVNLPPVELPPVELPPLLGR